MNKPDLSKPAKYKVLTKGRIFLLRKRRKWLIFSWYETIFETYEASEIIKKANELTGIDIQNDPYEII
ncbi:hypothetical protein LCGC14_1042760 [marine sediment metagenome]|uniref:Uncharacterized protein n=2 Tax=root TaxID=1 RepID=A0A831QJU5_9FLAO|nr:hypothetical protein [Pricia antarctica]